MNFNVIIFGADGRESYDVQEAEAEYGRRFSLGTYFTGLIHGLQPDALLVLLPALALPSGPAAAYLGTFLVRTLLGFGFGSGLRTWYHRPRDMGGTIRSTDSERGSRNKKRWWKHGRFPCHSISKLGFR